MTLNPPWPPDEWTRETIAAMTVVPAIILACLIFAGLAFYQWRHCRPTDGPLWFVGGVGCIVAALVASGLLWWGMYPWDARYHQWRAVAGTVATVDSRLTPAGDHGMEDKYVVMFRGNQNQYGVLDTRAATVRPGDQLTLACVRRWQWSGSHGYDCTFVRLVRKYPT